MISTHMVDTMDSEHGLVKFEQEDLTMTIAELARIIDTANVT